MTAARRISRYVALFAVVLIVYWTTWSSHTTYSFKSKLNSQTEHGGNTELTTTEPTLQDLEAIVQEEEGVSSEQTSIAIPSSVLDSPIDTSTEDSTEGEYTHQYLHKSKSQSSYKTKTPYKTTIGDLPSTATTAHETAIASQSDATGVESEKGGEYGSEKGSTDQHKQIENGIDSFEKPVLDGQDITTEKIEAHVQSIIDLNVKIVERLTCPGETLERPRYEVLRKKSRPRHGIKYLFAMDLYQSIEIMPRLLGTVVQAAKFLGPENCGISIVEGRSTDGTYNVLHELRSSFSDLGLRYWLQKSDLDPKNSTLDRIEALARLRNMAFDPIISETDRFSEKPLLIFINDVVPCPDDVYELIYQHELQGAVQTCAMDWIEKGENFYDVWVSRSMTGDTFWEIPQDGSWVFVQNLFYDDPFTKDKFNRKMPFQVFSCWGGMTIIDASPFIFDSLRIRRNYEGECYGGEPQLLGSDLAKLGLSRVQTIPEVNIGYTNSEGLQVKTLRKYVHELVDVDTLIETFADDNTTERIDWRPPPSRYRCMPDFKDHWWVDTWYDPKKEAPNP